MHIDNGTYYLTAALDVTVTSTWIGLSSDDTNLVCYASECFAIWVRTHEKVME